MLTKLRMVNFKRFRDAEVDLGEVAVLIGPNNSGKTTALQALALWNLGLRKYVEKRGVREPPKERPGVTINRQDLVSVPVAEANQLWKDTHAFAGGREGQRQIPIQITVEGVTEDVPWSFGLEFGWANEESFRCRPLARAPIPPQASDVRLAFLPPMSGLASNEDRLMPGAVAVRVGQGRTAEVLRNLCFELSETNAEAWGRVRAKMNGLFRVDLLDPAFIAERGALRMSYRDPGGAVLDLSSAGRGLQQTLLLLVYLEANPGAVLLLDEPDAHLEILRQKEIYDVLTEAAQQTGGQVVAASHSEVWLDAAADRDVVVAFVGKPHRIDDRSKKQVAKALKEIGFVDYYQAEQVGWVLYLEGSTDLAILRAFAKTLAHAAAPALDRPFLHTIGNEPKLARRHFDGLREAMPGLIGVCIVDNDARVDPVEREGMVELKWVRREIENYLSIPHVLYAFAEQSGSAEAIGPLFGRAEAVRRRSIMERLVRENVPPAALDDPAHRFWLTTKASDDFLDVIFERYFQELGLRVLLGKTDYHRLAALVPRDLIDADVVAKLDIVASQAARARPLRDPETAV